MMERFVMPDLYCPFTPAINEHAKAFKESTVQWALIEIIEGMHLRKSVARHTPV